MSITIPGMPNLHSHAFQRAMAGLTERRAHEQDSFWTWREWMYRFAAQITPEQLRVIATQLYVEMLEAGYTSVCEFHYLHHQPNGKPYDNPAEMSQALIQAALDTGIRLTLLPVLYQRGGFDDRALNEKQLRFAHCNDAFLLLLEILQKQQSETIKIGIALHSLRAVSMLSIQAVLQHVKKQKLPLHIHIAEQTTEVNDCIAVHGLRPVDYLFEHVDVNADWTLVHATHLSEAEIARVAKSKATVAICTTTEANLGDGFFPCKQYAEQGGRFGIGSDSNTSVSPIEELRWLEYGQRLQHQQRNIFTAASAISTGENLWKAAVDAGRISSQQGDDRDKLFLREDQAEVHGISAQSPYDGVIFAGNQCAIEHVEVAGVRLVEQGRHRIAELARNNYIDVMRALLNH